MNKLCKINLPIAKAKIQNNLDYYKFLAEFDAEFIEVLKKFEGKEISKRIETALKKLIKDNKKFSEVLSYTSYNKRDDFGYRAEIEIKVEDGAFGDEKRTMRYTLSNEDYIFSFEACKELTASFKFVQKWIAEYEDDLLKVDDVVGKWNAIIDQLDAIEPEMGKIPSECYNSRY